MMMPPCFSFHAQTRLRNSSRPRSRLDFFSSRRICLSTMPSVAMPAWSGAGQPEDFRAVMRALRLRMSWMVLLRTCPCAAPR